MMIKLIAYLCFFLSGFAALVHELSWSRILKQVFISESLSTALVLIIFFGGMAVGSYFAAALSKFFYPAKSSFASLFIFSILNLVLAFLTYLTGSFFNPEHLFSSLMLAPISILLGSLFPLLSNFYVAYRENGTEKSNTVSKIYFVNTFAGLIAIVFVIFFAFKQFGLKLTLHNLAILHLSIFTLSFMASLFNMKAVVVEIFESIKIFTLNLSLHSPKNQLSKAFDDDEDDEIPPNIEAQGSKVLLWLSFSFGFILLGLELVWMRAFSLILASSVYSFAMVLAAVIFGLALGTFIFYLVAKPLQLSLGKSFENDIEHINWLVLLLAALIFISSFSFKSLTGTYLYLIDSVGFLLNDFHREDLYKIALSFMKFVLAGIVVVPVSATIAFASTYLLQIFTYSDYLNDRTRVLNAGANVGKVFSINTLGGILGSFVTVFFFIPSLEGGLNQCLLIFNLIALLTLAITLSFSKEKQYFLFFIAALCFIALIFLKPNFITARTASGAELYYALKYRGEQGYYVDDALEEVLFHQDGLYSTVTVLKDSFANTIYLKNNAKVEAGIPIEDGIFSAADMQTQVLLGVAPKYFKDEFKNILLIGMGSGITLDSLAMISGDAKLCVAEIEDLVFKAADKFFSQAWQAIPDKKITRYNGNARSLIKSSKEKYDLIVSQPSDPWLSADMFTDEFWRLAHSKLSKDGIFVQWLQLYSLEPKYLLLTLNTLKHNFKYLLIIHPPRTAEIIILASDKDFRFRDFNVDKYPYLKTTLSRVSIHNSADFMADIMLAPKDVKKLLITETPRLDLPAPMLNNANNSLLEFHTAENFYKFSETINQNLQALTTYVSFEHILSLAKYNSESEKTALVQALRANYQKSLSGQSLKARASFYKNKLYTQSLSSWGLPLLSEEDELEDTLVLKTASEADAEYKLKENQLIKEKLLKEEALKKQLEIDSNLSEEEKKKKEELEAEEDTEVQDLEIVHKPLNISSADEKNYKSLLGIGVKNFEQGFYDDAEKNFRAALKIDPNLDQAYLYLAQIKLLMKDDNKFLEYINYCLRINPFNVKALYLAADYNYSFASLARATFYVDRLFIDTDYKNKLTADEINKLLKIRKKLAEILEKNRP
jgi:spermidine synthase/MFS family permease